MSAFLDGELASDAHGRMERHAGECSECRRVLDGLRRMLGLLGGLSPVSAEPDTPAIVAGVRARLHERPTD
jgi:anti-sigma factor RsiW